MIPRRSARLPRDQDKFAQQRAPETGEMVADKTRVTYNGVPLISEPGLHHGSRGQISQQPLVGHRIRLEGGPAHRFGIRN